MLVRSLENKISALDKARNDAINSRDMETKSSAGDKYETGREMMQKEIDNYEKQLAAMHRQMHECNAVNLESARHTIGLGSLVSTNEGWYYFATGYGKLEVENTNVMVVSLGSPLGQSLNGYTKGDRVKFLTRTIQIIEVQ